MAQKNQVETQHSNRIKITDHDLELVAKLSHFLAEKFQEHKIAGTLDSGRIFVKHSIINEILETTEKRSPEEQKRWTNLIYHTRERMRKKSQLFMDSLKGMGYFVGVTRESLRVKFKKPNAKCNQKKEKQATPLLNDDFDSVRTSNTPSIKIVTLRSFKGQTITINEFGGVVLAVDASKTLYQISGL